MYLFLFSSGVGGNLVAVQASRLSTFLHQRGRPGKMPKGVKFKGCLDTFCGSGKYQIIQLFAGSMFSLQGVLLFL